MDERDLRCDIVEVGRRLYARGLIGGNEGNISVRRLDTLFVTPAGVCKGFLTPEMIVRTDLEGRPQGGGRASTEILMHTAVYRRRADVRAVVHAHPPTATGFAAAGIPLDRPLIAEAVVTLGAVPIIPYGQPSTTELAQSVGDAICTAHALLMANHGAITVGDGIYRAWERMETVEQLARVALVTRILGQDRLLSGTAVEGLLAARTEAGYPPPACAPGMEAASGLPLGGAAGPGPHVAGRGPGLPVAGPGPRVAGREPGLPVAGPSSDGTVTLTRRELVRLIEDAVERFGGAGRGRA